MYPPLSVAMTTFNGATYLREQLDSIAAQTVLPAELVVCDDQSTDATPQIVRDFAATAPFPVRFEVNEQRLGFGRNFMKAASLCSGRLIAFSDQDDLWEPTKVSEVQAFLARTDHLLVVHDYAVFFQDGSRPDIPSYFRWLGQSGWGKAVNLKGCALTVRQELLDRVGWPPEELRHRWSHDIWLCVVANFLEVQGFLDRPLIRYRIHGRNVDGGIWGGRDRVRRVLRSLHLPPFTSRLPLDALLSYYYQNGVQEMYDRALDQCARAMTEAQIRRARTALRNRIAYLDFPATPAYASLWSRTAAATGMFLRGVYRPGDGVLGLMQDIYGNRRGRI